MDPYYQDDAVTLWHGDCRAVLPTLGDASLHAIVTDPPYELAFMGRKWDASGVAFDPAVWAECLRVLKPGGHLLAFGGSRTWHRLAAAIEDAGFEIRDSIAWLYGSGFPKSLDVSKAIDKAAGAERETKPWLTRDRVGVFAGDGGDTTATSGNLQCPTCLKWKFAPDHCKCPRDNGAQTPDAATWQGWGTALKPAFEPVVVARKPLAGTVAANVLTHGTGALNIDACRVEGAPPSVPQPTLGVKADGVTGFGAGVGRNGAMSEASGRWPTNVVLDQHTAAELDKQSGELTSGANPTRRGSDKFRDAYGDFRGQESCTPARGADSGGASRFFPVFRYEAKAPTSERPRVPKSGASGMADFLGGTKKCRVCGCQTLVPPSSSPSCGHDDYERIPSKRADEGTIAHPTVKPLDLMRWLVRLVTPPGGTILDPFAGSGTTAEACVIEGFRCVTIEREADYLPLITARLSKPIETVLDLGAL